MHSHSGNPVEVHQTFFHCETCTAPLGNTTLSSSCFRHFLTRSSSVWKEATPAQHQICWKTWVCLPGPPSALNPVLSWEALVLWVFCLASLQLQRSRWPARLDLPGSSKWQARKSRPQCFRVPGHEATDALLQEPRKCLKDSLLEQWELYGDSDVFNWCRLDVGSSTPLMSAFQLPF